MSLRLEMLQVARLARSMLADAAPLVSGFLRSSIAPDGGFVDRSGRSDLYYSVFGVEALLALHGREEWGGGGPLGAAQGEGAPPCPAAAFERHVASFGDGAGLDLVHLGCLARCQADLVLLGGPAWASPAREALAARLERHRTPDGGYHASLGHPHGSVYGCFLAMASYQDLDLPMPRPEGLLACLAGLRAGDGGYTNERELPVGNTPAAAAAVCVLRTLGAGVPAEIADWLLARAHPQGGFVAMPGAPMPDLLSTATALHALTRLGVPMGRWREPCLDFLDSLWVNRGAFHGNWADEAVDVEYTYYGLLALGHVAAA